MNCPRPISSSRSNSRTATRSEMIRIQKELAAQVGKPKREMPLMMVNQEILEVAYQVAGDRIEGALYNEKKVDRSKAVNALER